MSSGLSMASVNKIKELTNAREYNLALDIIENQDLSKSLNPQFLRLCGEVYENTNRFSDARRVYVMARRLAPKAKRIIFSLMSLYFKMGYKELATTYYKIYMSDADNSIETEQTKYTYEKAVGSDKEELVQYLESTYTQMLDYDWSYELFLLYKIIDRDEEAKRLCELYIATYKNSSNAQKMQMIESGEISAEEQYFVFSDEERLDDDPEQESTRCEEKKLLEADELRIHPKEAEITVIFDELIEDEDDVSSKWKKKRALKEEKKRKKIKEQLLQQAENAGLSVDGDASDVEKNDNDGNESDTQIQRTDEDNDKRNLFKIVYGKIKKSADDLIFKKNQDKDDAVEEVFGQISLDIEEDKHDENLPSEEKITDESNESDESNAESETDVVNTSNIEDDIVMMNINLNDKKTGPVVSVDLEDNFIAEAEFNEEINDESVSENKTESADFDDLHINTDLDVSENVNDSDSKKGFAFEDAQINDSTDNEELFEVDDFSSLDDEFDSVVDSHSVEDSISKAFLELDDIEEEKVTDFNDVFKEFESDDNDFGETYSFSIKDFNEETEIENQIETTEEFEEVNEEETAEESEEVNEEEAAEEFEEVNEEEAAEEFEEVNEEEKTEEFEEIEEETAEEFEEVNEEETAEEFEEINEEEAEEFQDDVTLFKNEKNRVDYPVFKSSLFPTYNRKVTRVENNFNEIMTEAQDKIQENFQKEQQLLKEAEELLASLGIDMGDIAPGTDTND